MGARTTSATLRSRFLRCRRLSPTPACLGRAAADRQDSVARAKGSEMRVTLRGKPRAGHLVREVPGDAAAGRAPRGTGGTNHRLTPHEHQVVRQRHLASSEVTTSAPDVLGERIAPDITAG